MNSTKYYSKIKTQKERLALKKRNLHRQITHEDYEYENAKKIKDGVNSCYRKILFAIPKNIRLEQTDSESNIKYNERYRIDDQYWEMESLSHIGPRFNIKIGLVMSLSLLAMHFIGDERFGIFTFLIWLLFTVFTLFNIAYNYNIPKNKELILDRKKGTITFPGSYWEPNNTMYLKKLKLFKPSMGTTAATATGIKILSPKKLRNSFHFSFGFGDNSDEITLLTWYMDSNRPLPPCDYFKPYRQQDFERRKAEGFPPPLYPAFFRTPEDTNEQQAERNKYWIENIGSDDDGSLYCEVLRGKDEFFDMENRQWMKK